MPLPDGGTGPEKRWLSPAGEAARFESPRLTNERVSMALATTKSPDRKDRLLVLTAIAQVFLNLPGKTSEIIGLDRKVKANTTTKRTHPVFNQGVLYFVGVCAKW
jgi:hypothetical protein